MSNQTAEARAVNEMAASILRDNAQLISIAPDLLRQRDELIAALKSCAQVAEEIRSTQINECVTAIRQIDVDAAAACARGNCMVISALANNAIAKAEKGQS